jgi:hypothetical protein
MPDRVRAAVEGYLGSPVVSAVNQRGGFSPGLAARVRCRDGTQAFVKAIGTALNPHSPGMHRSEGAIAAGLPEYVPAPRLRLRYDDGDWVALVFDEIDGRPPRTPWQADELRRVRAALTDLAAALTPCPLAGAPTVEERIGDQLTAYRRLATEPAAPPAGRRAPRCWRGMPRLGVPRQRSLRAAGQPVTAMAVLPPTEEPSLNASRPR